MLARLWRSIFGSGGAPGMLLQRSAMGVASTGTTMDEERAWTVPAVWAAISVIARTVASLPLHVYRRQPDGGRERVTTHPAERLLTRQPNPHMTAMSMRETLVSHVLGWGNGFALIDRLQNGNPVRLYPLHPSRVTLPEVPDRTQALEYLVDGTYLVPADLMLHVVGLSQDGVWGMSPLRLFRETLSLAKETERYGERFFRNSGMPAGVLKHPKTLGEEEHANLRRSWERLHSGSDNAHRIAILEEGMEFQAMAIDPEDAQFLDTRKFQLGDVARIFHVPPHLIGDLERATFSNIEHQSISFVQHTVGPWLRRIEQELQRKLFRDPALYAEHVVEGLLRGDTSTRFAAYHTAVSDGWMSRNEVRRLENLAEVDGLDGFLVPLNMGDVDGGDATGEPAGAGYGGGEEGEAEDAGELAERMVRLNAGQLRAELERLRRVEADKARRAIRKGEPAEKWLERFWAQHADEVCERLLPNVSAAAVGAALASGAELDETDPRLLGLLEDAGRGMRERSWTVLAGERDAAELEQLAAEDLVDLSGRIVRLVRDAGAGVEYAD